MAVASIRKTRSQAIGLSRNGLIHRAPQTGRTNDILDAATSIFARDGYRSTDVQAVADALNVGKGTVYRQFPSKRALFLAAVDRGMQQLHESIMRVVDEDDDPLEQIACAVRA